MARRRPGRVVASLAALLVLPGCGAFSGDDGGSAPEAKPLSGPTSTPSTPDPATQPALARFYQQRISWTACASTFQCGKVTVPVDWAQPAGATIDLAVTRLRARHTPIGSLLVNPGGPGVSGVSYLQQGSSTFGRAVRNNFDLVSWDPRGVGRSAPVECLDTAQADRYTASDWTPDDASEVTTFQKWNDVLADGCEQRSGPVLGHVDTLSTVKDMDVLRAVLGDSRLTFYGASYGTYLGAWYAELFPWRVGRFVLDGAVDPSLTMEKYAEGQALGFNRGARAYVSHCQRASSCPLRGTVDDGISQLSALIEQADQRPLPTSDQGRVLTQSLMLTGIALGMYSDTYWSSLTKGIIEAMRGDGTTLLKLADTYYERDDKAAYPQTIGANMAIYCLDHPAPGSEQEVARLAERLGRQYPPEGEVIGWGTLGCLGWPVPPALKPQRITAAGAAPILVVGTTGDPATPYEWAQSLASQLSSGRLLTWEGEGHTAYGQGGGGCVARVVESYLIAGTVPAQDVTCGS